jgi:hypothetical protein
LSQKKEITDRGELIAYCGLWCNNCDIFNRQNIEGIAAEIERLPENVNCNGCKNSNKALCLHWLPIGLSLSRCAIRECAINHRVEVCSQCKEFPCGQLQEFFKENERAKENLMKIKRFGIEKFVKEELRK